MLYAVELKSSAGTESCGQLVVLYAVELRSSRQLVLLCAVELQLSSSVVIIHCAYGWVSMPLQVHHVCRAGIRLKCIYYFSHVPVWCTASLIGSSPILAVAVLRVNALSPLLTSLAGSSPALVLRVSWDGPTPFCFGIVFTYWSAVLHCSFFRFRLTAGRTAIIHHKPVRLFCRCMCSSYFSEYGCPGRWLWQWRLLRGQLWQLFRVLISTF